MAGTDSGRFRYEIEELKGLIHASNERIKSLEKDMWIGNGKPGITTRMALVEDTVMKINRNLSKIVWLILATLVSVLVKLFIFKG